MSDIGIVQISVEYIPAGYNSNLWMDDDKYFCTLDGKRVLPKDVSSNGELSVPVISIDISGYAGMSYSDFSSGVEFEFIEGGGLTIDFEKELEAIANIAIRLLKKHPTLSEENVALNEYKHVLFLSFPTIWTYWGEYDPYSNEYDSGTEFVGVLDMKRLFEKQI